MELVKPTIFKSLTFKYHHINIMCSMQFELSTVMFFGRIITLQVELFVKDLNSSVAFSTTSNMLNFTLKVQIIKSIGMTSLLRLQYSPYI